MTEPTGRLVASVADFEALAAEGTVAPVQDPVAVLHLDTATRTTSRTTLGWLGAGEAALLVRDTRGTELLRCPADQLPVALARLTSLAPVTPAERHERPFTDNPMETLLGDDAVARRAGFDELDAQLAFTLGVRTEEEERLLAVVTGPSGSWLLEPRPDKGWSLRPVPSTAVYRRFCALVPLALG